MDARTKRLRSDAKLLSPIINVGKNGVTDGLISLVDRELTQKHLIKIKLLKGALAEDATKAGKKSIAQTIATRSRARIIDQVGNIIVLHR